MASNLIKRAYAETEYTPENIQELLKCKKDPVHFICNYIYLQHPTKGKTLFNLYDYQRELVESLQNNRWVVALLSRQMGKCFLGSTSINIIKKPSKFKMAVLKIIDRDEYENVKKLFDMQD
jgi:hypothetical protein